MEKSKIVWIDLGDIGTFHVPGSSLDMWQDHGLGVLRTIMHSQGS